MSAELLDRLVEVRRLIEAHEAAVFLLEAERNELRMKLSRAGFTAPTVEPAA